MKHKSLPLVLDLVLYSTLVVVATYFLMKVIYQIIEWSMPVI